MIAQRFGSRCDCFKLGLFKFIERQTHFIWQIEEREKKCFFFTEPSMFFFTILNEILEEFPNSTLKSILLLSDLFTVFMRSCLYDWKQAWCQWYTTVYVYHMAHGTCVNYYKTVEWHEMSSVPIYKRSCRARLSHNTKKKVTRTEKWRKLFVTHTHTHTETLSISRKRHTSCNL